MTKLRMILCVALPLQCIYLGFWFWNLPVGPTPAEYWHSSLVYFAQVIAIILSMLGIIFIPGSNHHD